MSEEEARQAYIDVVDGLVAEEVSVVYFIHIGILLYLSYFIIYLSYLIIYIYRSKTGIY